MGLFDKLLGRTPQADRATDKQIDYIRSLVAEWDPNQPDWARTQMDNATRKTLTEALRIAGISDYNDPAEFRNLTKLQASQTIDRLKRYDP